VAGRPVLSTGASQGGALALAAAHLAGDTIAGCAPDVPFLAHIRRAAEVADDSPYDELVRWLHTHRDRAAAAFAALAYVDVAVLAPYGWAPSLWSVAIRDTVCPPSTVFAAHNRYGGPAELSVWEWNEHEGGEGHQVLEQAAWLARHSLAPALESPRPQ
jgi:cephalosporin-C deacetylase